MGGLGSPYGQPGHHCPNGGGSVSSKRTINRSEWESRCLWLSVLPFRSANYLGGVRGSVRCLTIRPLEGARGGVGGGGFYCLLVGPRKSGQRLTWRSALASTPTERLIV